MHYELMQTQVAGRHREAEQARLARAVAQARHAEREHGTPHRERTAQRLFRVLRGWQPSRDNAS